MEVELSTPFAPHEKSKSLGSWGSGGTLFALNLRYQRYKKLATFLFLNHSAIPRMSIIPLLAATPGKTSREERNNKYAKVNNNSEVVSTVNKSEAKWRELLKGKDRAAVRKRLAGLFDYTDDTINSSPKMSLGGRSGKCWVAIGGSNPKGKGGNRPNFKYGPTQTSVLLSYGAMIWKLLLQQGSRGDFTSDIIWPGNLGDEVSHRCGDSTCGKPDHICIESHQTNEARNYCPGQIICILCETLLDACCCSRTEPCINIHEAETCSLCKTDVEYKS